MRDIPLPSETAALDNMDGGSPCPKDGDFFYARPDAAETEEAINSSLSGICVQYGVAMYSVCT